MFEDAEQCYRAVLSRDPRFDGWFFGAVTSTGIYCRPSCPARTPKRENMRFYATAAAAQLAGFRACKRCRPDATPGSPEWNQRADLVGRAMRLIADGVVDREGVAGLAAPPQLQRASPAPPARRRGRRRADRACPGATRPDRADPDRDDGRRRARRSRSRAASRASGSSTTPCARCSRLTPTELRARARRAVTATAPAARRRPRPARSPCVSPSAPRSMPARSSTSCARARCPAWSRSMPRRTAGRWTLPFGAATVALTPLPDHIACTLRLDDLRDLPAAVQRCRRLLDLDADPVAVSALLEHGPAARAVGAQASRAAGSRPRRRLRAPRPGDRRPTGVRGGCPHRPRPDHGEPGRGVGRTRRRADPRGSRPRPPWPRRRRSPSRCPRPRAATVQRVAAAVARGRAPHRPRRRARGAAAPSCSRSPASGRWTVAVRRAAGARRPGRVPARPISGFATPSSSSGARATRSRPRPGRNRWRPWRSYGLMHLWTSLSG